MIRNKAVLGAILLAMTTVASAKDATLAKAVAAYNILPSNVRLLAVAPAVIAPGARVTQLPAWLAEAGLSEKEAAATVAAFGVYGEKYMLNYQTRRWGAAAKIAGGVTEAIFSPTGRLPDALPNEPPARELADGRRTALLGAMRDMGTCSGALVQALNKAVRLRAADDATRLLTMARRDLGASAYPPDESCLS